MATLTFDLYRAIRYPEFPKKKSEKRKEKAAFVDNIMAQKAQGQLHPHPGDAATGRPADVPSETVDGVQYVLAVGDDDEDGISTSAKIGCFGFGFYCYFLLPIGTDIQKNLDVKHTPTAKDPEHHSIRCRTRMRMDAFQGALDNLARSAIAKAVEQKRASIYTSETAKG